MSGLRPGESVLKETGVMPVTYAKTTFNAVNGKLVLTDQRLVFAGGAIQNPIQLLAGGREERVEIALSDVTGVEKGFMATVKVMAGREYVFKGMGGAGDWVNAIQSAAQRVAAPQYAPPPPPAAPYAAPPPPAPQYAPPSPPQRAPPPAPAAPAAPAAGGAKFCTSCGTRAGPSDRFCGGCGSAL